MPYTVSKVAATRPHVFQAGVGYVAANNRAAVALVCEALGAQHLQKNAVLLPDGVEATVGCYLDQRGAMLLGSEDGAEVGRTGKRPQSIPGGHLPRLIVKPLGNRVAIYHLGDTNRLLPQLGRKGVANSTVSWDAVDEHADHLTMVALPT